MRIVALVGPSGSGKTRMVMRLVGEFNRRGLKTGVIKHCRHGFELDPEAKDSRRFWDAGADGVALLAPDKWALLQRCPTEIRSTEVAARLFSDQDVVLVEGGKQERGIRKIAVRRPGSGEDLSVDPPELAAVISEEDLPGDTPVFHPDQVPEIADFILNEEET
jgi:molybdopterin-guanine dinucleotide biosynthesis protein B